MSLIEKFFATGSGAWMSLEDACSSVSQLIEQLQDGRLDRRSFLRQVVAVGLTSSVAYALLQQSQATAQDVTTYAIGEETTPPAQRPPSSAPGTVTTQALGEESSPPMTTQAVGEESAPPQVTTRALGEETTRPPQMTTKAIGEEAAPPQMTTFALGEENNQRPPTTLAVGEESSPGRPSGIRPPRTYPYRPPARWRNWYRW